MNTRASRKTFRQRLDEMTGQLRKDILNGIYAPGAYLPSERLLAEQFRLSNNTVRQGLSLLVQEGLIVKKNRLGNMVAVAETDRAAQTEITLGITNTLENDIRLTQLLAEFHAKYPSIRVRTLSLSPDGRISLSYKEMIEAFASQGILDVFLMTHMHFREFEEHALLHLFAELPARRETYSFLHDAFTSGGKLYVQPVVFSPLVLCYNRDHFRDAGLLEPDGSWTWDDCMRAATALTRPNERYGLFFYVLSENRWPAFLLQSGMKFERDERGVCDIRGTRLLDSIRLYKSLIHSSDIFPKFYTESSHDANKLFMEGKVSMILSTYMSLSELMRTNLPYDISPLPYMRKPLSLMITYGFAVGNHSKQKDAAKIFIEFLASREAQTIIRKHALSIPSHKPAAETAVSDSLNRPSRYALFRELIPTFRLHADLNLSASSMEAMKDLLKEYWSDLIDEETLCEKIRRLPPGGTAG